MILAVISGLGFSILIHLIIQKIQPESQVVLLDLQSDTGCEMFRKVRLALRNKPKALRLELVGAGEFSQDIVLAIHSLLIDAKKGGLKLTTQAHSSLYNGSLLLWLVGEKRIIRSNTAFFEVDRTEDEEDDDLDFISEERTPFLNRREMVYQSNFKEIVRLIDEYIPVKELAGQRLEMKELSEYGLVDSESTDKQLLALMNNGT